MKLTKQREQL
jgi:hypothetical protein